MKKRMSLYTWMIVGNFIFPFMNVLFPYLYWRQNRQTEDTAFTKEACNLLNFQILFSFIMIGVFVFGWYQAIVGWSIGGYDDGKYYLSVGSYAYYFSRKEDVSGLAADNTVFPGLNK